MRKLKKDSPLEISGHHGKSMWYLGITIIFGIASILVPTQMFGKEPTWLMGLPLFCIPFIFLFIMVSRSENALCPECAKKMKKKGRIEVIDDIEAFGRYGVAPYNVFCCEWCEGEWRVPAISIGEGGSLTRKQYKEMIEPVAPGQRR